jgi:hypothetical protein
MKQYEAVRKTLEKLGGIATLGQLNQEVFKIKNCEWKTKTPFASIRSIVQLDKEIYKIKPGLYALKKFKSDLEGKGIFIETDKNKDSKEIVEFNHSYYQGIILSMGNLKMLFTYVPKQDKNKKFINTILDNISTIKDIPDFSYPYFKKRCSTIDVIWFNQREMPHSFFEVEYSTDIQNSLLKFNDLQDFNCRMIIVSDKKRKPEYESKLKYSSFNDIKARVDFLDYDSLNKQYENIIEQQKMEVIL